MVCIEVKAGGVEEAGTIDIAVVGGCVPERVVIAVALCGVEVAVIRIGHIGTVDYALSR